MAIFSKDITDTLQKFWISLSGWNDIKQFGKIFLFILRRPFRNTIQIYKTIEPEESFRFLVQSFIIFTVITSLFTVFRGNDILKSILLMLNQLFFLTLSTILYFFIFSRMSALKKVFSEYLTLYAVYMGFILPFFALGYLLNWELILMITDPGNRITAPSPFKALFRVLAPILFVGLAIYYSTSIIKYYWKLNFVMIALGLILVFVLLTPLQMLWIRLQCKAGITPEFAFNSLEHRKATYAMIGCEDVSCRKCLLIGKWKYAERSLQKQEQNLQNAYTSEYLTISIMKRNKSAELQFVDDGNYYFNMVDTSGLYQRSTTKWFISDDGNQIFFENRGFDIIELSAETLTLKYEVNREVIAVPKYDTLFISAVH